MRARMAYPPPAPARPPRPIGVTILAFLVVLVGVILVLLALLAVVAGLANLAAGGGSLFLILAGVFFILSLLLLLAGLGLWNLRPWAWWLAVLVLVLQIARSLLAFDTSQGLGEANRPLLLSLILPGLILVYLFAVRGHFRS